MSEGSQSSIPVVQWGRNVMAGLVPAIHVFRAREKEDVDARHKAGHDE
jgi:hypothetical protein